MSDISRQPPEPEPEATEAEEVEGHRFKSQAERMSYDVERAARGVENREPDAEDEDAPEVEGHRFTGPERFKGPERYGR